MEVTGHPARDRGSGEMPYPQSRRNTLVGLPSPEWEEQVQGPRGNRARRFSYLNDLKRLTSVHTVVLQNHFLESLPRATKIFLAASALDAMLIMALSIEQLVVVRLSEARTCALSVSGTDDAIILHYSIVFPVRACSTRHPFVFSCFLQGGDFLHVLLAMLVTSVFFLWFVVSAIVHENAYELLITTVLSAVIAVRVVYFVVSGCSLLSLL